MNLVTMIKSKFWSKKGHHKIPASSFNLANANLPRIRDEDEKGNFYIHIHIPKTGGSTFNKILENNFKESYEGFSGRFVHLFPPLNDQQILAFMRKHTGIKAVSSHLFRAVLPYQNSNRKIVSIAFIRNPVDMFFSYYFHMRHRHGVECPEKEFKLENYIKYRLKSIKDKSFNGYLKHLTGIESEESFQYVKELTENEHLYLFDTYHMKNSLEFLCSRFPQDFYIKNYQTENISKKDQEVTESMKSIIREKVSPYDWKLMELVNKTTEIKNK